MEHYSLNNIARNLLINAKQEANKSLCIRKKVGAILFDIEKGAIVGYGFNSSNTPCKYCTRGKYNFRQDGCYSIHAEVNAIFDFINNEINFNKKDFLNNKINFNIFDLSKGKSLMVVCTHGPCDQCIKYMVKFGIKYCYYNNYYTNDYSKWNHEKINIIQIVHEIQSKIFIDKHIGRV